MTTVNSNFKVYVISYLGLIDSNDYKKGCILSVYQLEVLILNERTLGRSKMSQT